MGLVLILGLRRSGTTALWRAFERLPGFVGFDEPFNPKLCDLPRDHRKGTLDSFFDVVDRDRAALMRRLAPISAKEECEPGLTDAQGSYIAWLVGQAQDDNVVVDETRCGFKVPALANTLDPAVVIHISRDPAEWVRSHLLPTEQGISYARQRLRSRLTRLRTRRMPMDYGFEQVVASAAFAQRAASLGLGSSQLDQLRAVEKLFLLWLLHENEVAARGTELWGDRYWPLAYADLARDPETSVSRALERAGVDHPASAVAAACEHIAGYGTPTAGGRDLTRIRSVIAGLDQRLDVRLEERLIGLHDGAMATGSKTP